MINNIANVDTRLPMSVGKMTAGGNANIITPPILSFKKPFIKEKADMRIKKIKRLDDIVITGDIDDDYIEVIEYDLDDGGGGDYNLFTKSPPKEKRKAKILKDCYVIDYIQAPKSRCGLGTNAVKSLAEKAMFDSRAEGRIVTYSAPIWRESSPAIFFYKLGFRFMDKAANSYIEECLLRKEPDIPPQTGMMYLPKTNLHKLLRYGELF